jgi:hypothetical protein
MLILPSLLPLADAGLPMLPVQGWLKCVVRADVQRGTGDGGCCRARRRAGRVRFSGHFACESR